MRHAPSAILPNCSSHTGKHPQPVVSKHPDIELTPLYVLLRNRGRADRSWMKATRSASLSSVSTTDACAMPRDESSLTS